MLSELLRRTDVRLATSLVIGLLVGAERQQRIAEGGHASAGIRTFALAALLGGVAALLGGWAPLALFGVAIGAMAIAAYVLGDRSDPGLTTEIALVLTYAIGALSMHDPQLALGAGIVVALVLAFRARIHGFVRDTMSPTELRDALLFAAAALVALPMIPDEPVDPLGALNLFVLWRLAVVMMGVTLAAHVARRVLGARWGVVIAGLASGFVSSSATVAAMGAKTKEASPSGEAPDTAGPERGFLAAGAASSIATFVQMAVLVGTASPALLAYVGPALGAGGLAALAFAAAFALRASAPPAQDHANDVSALRIRSAFVFALLVSVVTFLAGIVEEAAGAVGVIVGTAVAAFADAHAAGASVASVHAGERIADAPAAAAVLLCLTTNGVTKMVLAWSSGTRSYARWIVVGQVIALGIAWAALAATYALA